MRVNNISHKISGVLQACPYVNTRIQPLRERTSLDAGGVPGRGGNLVLMLVAVPRVYCHRRAIHVQLPYDGAAALQLRLRLCSTADPPSPVRHCRPFSPDLPADHS